METTGSTHGSQQRQPRRLRGQVLSFSLSDEAESLRQEPAWERSGKNSRTLVEESGIRLTLIVLSQAAVLEEHHAPGAVSVHLLTGSVSFSIGAESRTLGPGQIVVLEPEVSHSVKALEESLILLTITKNTSSAPRHDERAQD